MAEKKAPIPRSSSDLHDIGEQRHAFPLKRLHYSSWLYSRTAIATFMLTACLVYLLE